MPKLGEILVDEGIITPKLLQDLLTRQHHYPGRLGRKLVEIGFLSELELQDMLSRKFRTPAVNLDEMDIPKEVTESISRDLVAKLFFVPLHKTEHPRKVLVVAVPDPTNDELLEKIKDATRYDVRPYMAIETSVLRALKRHYDLGESDMGEGYQSFVSVSFSPGERALWKIESKKMIRFRRTEQLIEAALVELLAEKGYFTREEYRASLRNAASQ